MTNEENKNIEIETEATEPTAEPAETPAVDNAPKDTHVRDGIVAGAIAAGAAVVGVVASIFGAVFTKKSKDAFSK